MTDASGPFLMIEDLGQDLVQKQERGDTLSVARRQHCANKMPPAANPFAMVCCVLALPPVSRPGARIRAICLRAELRAAEERQLRAGGGSIPRHLYGLWGSQIRA